MVFAKPILVKVLKFCIPGIGVFCDLGTACGGARIVRMGFKDHQPSHIVGELGMSKFTVKALLSPRGLI